VGDAEAFLAEVRALEPRDPKAAMRQLERGSAAFREAFGVEGVLHGEFRAMVSGLRRRLDPRRPDASGLTVQAISWESFTNLGSLVAAAGQGDTDVLYLAPSDRRRDASPLTQVDAVHEFADPKVVMVVVGDGPPMLFRRSFLQSATSSVNPRTDIADAGQDLLDLAERSGYTARWLR